MNLLFNGYGLLASQKNCGIPCGRTGSNPRRIGTSLPGLVLSCGPALESNVGLSEHSQAQKKSYILLP